jgi:hypothetical protein
MYGTFYPCPIVMKVEFSRQIFGKSSNITFHEICPVGTELYHTDGWTDMTKLIVAFRSFAKAPNEMCSDIFAVINLVSYVLFNLEIRQ